MPASEPLGSFYPVPDLANRIVSSVRSARAQRCSWDWKVIGSEYQEGRSIGAITIGWTFVLLQLIVAHPGEPRGQPIHVLRHPEQRQQGIAQGRAVPSRRVGSGSRWIRGAGVALTAVVPAPAAAMAPSWQLVAQRAPVRRETEPQRAVLPSPVHCLCRPAPERCRELAHLAARRSSLLQWLHVSRIVVVYSQA